jgi:hypothetical protein
MGFGWMCDKSRSDGEKPLPSRAANWDGRPDSAMIGLHSRIVVCRAATAVPHFSAFQPTWRLSILRRV